MVLRYSNSSSEILTLYPWGFDPFYIVSYYINSGKISWIDSSAHVWSKSQFDFLMHLFKSITVGIWDLS